MSYRRLVITLALGSAALACKQSPSGTTEADSNVGDGDGDGDGTSGDGDGTSGDGDGAPGDGDGAPGDGDGAPGDGDDAPGDGDGDGDGDVYCDLASLSQQEPMWLESLPEDRNGSVAVPGLAVTPDAIFSGGFYVGGQTDAAFITRRDLDGQVQWTVDAPGYHTGSQRSLQWDGQYVYYLTYGDDAGIRRMTADGQIDESWSYPSDANLSILDFDVSSARVLAAAHKIVIFDEPDYYDAVTIWIDKTDSSIKATNTFGEVYADERATAVVPWAAGGHISALKRGDGSDLFLRGYMGATLSMDTSFLGAPAARFMHERPEGLLVAVDVHNAGKWGMWLLMVNPDGSESWRKPLEPCGASVYAGFSSVVVGPEHVFAVATVEVSKNLFAGVIIEFGFDGELQATHALAGAPEGRVLTDTIATDGEVVVVSGASVVAPGEFTGWVARIH